MSSETRSALNDQDAANVRRLINALNDVGIQAILTLAAIDEAKGDGELIARAVGSAFEDLGRSSREDFSDVAPSLILVMSLAETSGLFPEDFLISEESQQMCLHAFWNDRRAETV